MFNYILPYIVEIVFLGIVYSICKLHADKFKANIKITPEFHFVWAVIYAVPVIIVSLIYQSWWLLAALCFERFVLYNIVLNKIRGEKMFYIVANNSKPGFWDKIEVWWGKFYPVAWGLGILIFGFLQTKIHG